MRRWLRSHRDWRPVVMYPLVACTAAMAVLAAGLGQAEDASGLGLFIAVALATTAVGCWRIAKADIYTSDRGIRVTHIVSRSETVLWEHLAAVEVHADKLDRIVFRTVFGGMVHTDVYRCPPDRLFEALTDRKNGPSYIAMLGPKSFDRLVIRLRTMRDQPGAFGRGSAPNPDPPSESRPD